MTNGLVLIARVNKVGNNRLWSAHTDPGCAHDKVSGGKKKMIGLHSCAGDASQVNQEIRLLWEKYFLVAADLDSRSNGNGISNFFCNSATIYNVETVRALLNLNVHTSYFSHV